MGKKILITSIPSWNQITGSDTFSSLFASFENCDISNIYISGDVPDSPVCSRYFHIDEQSVVKGVLIRNVKSGKEVSRTSIVPSQPTEVNKILKLKRLRVILWARELAWKLGRWKTDELNAFLDEIRPEVLVFPIENYPYFNRLNQYIIDRCKPQKVIGYFWDDNFSYKQEPYNIFFKIERFFRRIRIRQLVRSCTDILAISPKMKEECDNEFGINSILLTKPIYSQDSFNEFEISTPIRFLYTGKLVIGREQTIAKVAAAIRQINVNGQKIILDIYTQTNLSENIRKQIDIPGCCVLHDPVPQSEVLRLQKEADVLLFVEALSNRNLTARLSFSTKLTDYFAAGKCIWAIGNADLGPIDYIKTEQAGFVSTNDSEIRAVLNQIVNHPDLVISMAKQGYQCGKRNHDYKTITSKLKSIINK